MQVRLVQCWARSRFSCLQKVEFPPGTKKRSWHRITSRRHLPLSTRRHTHMHGAAVSTLSGTHFFLQGSGAHVKPWSFAKSRSRESLGVEKLPLLHKSPPTVSTQILSLTHFLLYRSARVQRAMVPFCSAVCSHFQQELLSYLASMATKQLGRLACCEWQTAPNHLTQKVHTLFGSVCTSLLLTSMHPLR